MSLSHSTHSNKSRPDRAVLTIATGKTIYADMAINLALSICEWTSKIKIQIATEFEEKTFNHLDNVEVLKFRKGELGIGFSAKLLLDQISNAEQTLFIDCDCLAYNNVEKIFDVFQSKAVGVVGSSIECGEWFGDVSKILERFKLKEIPKFNGGLYYSEKGEMCSRVYKRARELEKQYDEIGLVRLRGRPNDELLMAIAMAENGLKAVQDDGTIMADPQAFPGKMSLNILKGHASLQNPSSPSTSHVAWNSLKKARPVLVHFLGSAHETPQYLADSAFLKYKKIVKNKYLAYVITRIIILIPGYFKQQTKVLLRPIYRFLIGTRPIKKSQRM